jgi:hypothetical protein
MATARPKSTADTAPQPQDAEHAFYRVIDAQCADLDELRRRWPDRTSPESVAIQDRLTGRAAPDGAAEQAVAALHRAYGGAALMPAPIRARLERYVDERLGHRPWPERDLSEELDRPAIVRKGRRRRREGTGA